MREGRGVCVEGMMVHAIQIDEAGGPEVLMWREVEVGEPGPGEVRLRHLAVGAPFIDVYFRKGVYAPPGGYPLIPGAEGVGEVEAVGAGVGDLKPGDRVAYQVQVGAYAEKRLIKADRVGENPRRPRCKGRRRGLPQGPDRPVPGSGAPSGSRRGRRSLWHAAAGGVGMIAAQWASAPGRR